MIGKCIKVDRLPTEFDDNQDCFPWEGKLCALSMSKALPDPKHNTWSWLEDSATILILYIIESLSNVQQQETGHKDIPAKTVADQYHRDLLQELPYLCLQQKKECCNNNEWLKRKSQPGMAVSVMLLESERKDYSINNLRVAQILIPLLQYGVI